MKNILKCFASLKEKQKLLRLLFESIYANFQRFRISSFVSIFLRKISASNQAQHNAHKVQLFYYNKKHWNREKLCIEEKKWRN